MFGPACDPGELKFAGYPIMVLRGAYVSRGKGIGSLRTCCDGRYGADGRLGPGVHAHLGPLGSTHPLTPSRRRGNWLFAKEAPKEDRWPKLTRHCIWVEMRGLLPDPVQGFISMPDLLQLDLRGRIPVVWFPSGRSGRLEGVPSSCPLRSGIVCIAPV